MQAMTAGKKPLSAGGAAGSPQTSTKVAKPALPVRQAKKPSAGTASSSNNAAGSSKGKSCANCGKSISGLPSRCSGCKQAYYCSVSCQKQAWPEHKKSCKAPSSSGGGSSPGSKAESSTGGKASSSSAPADKAAEESGAAGKEGAGPKEEPKTFNDALAMYLEQQAASKTDQLEASFETAIMLFVKGEFQAAISNLTKVKDMARERGDKRVEGEVFKWLGHAHNRLKDTAQAEKAFQEGIEFARKSDLVRLEIDCLGGLGVMLRAQGQVARSIETLEAALTLCERDKDPDSKATILCNLGSALVQTDSERALMCLREAVSMREEAVERLHVAGQREGLATALMEHANALVNLASALFITKLYEQAKICYERALEVFELVEDVEKVAKVLVNLANMSEIHVATPKAMQEAAEYRKRLVIFLDAHGVKRTNTQCKLCSRPVHVKEATKDVNKALIMLSCLHCLHNKCWEQRLEASSESDGVTCPVCEQPVPLVAQ